MVSHRSEHPIRWDSITDESDFSGCAEAEVQNAIVAWCASGKPLVAINSTWAITDGDGSLASIKTHLHETHKHLDKKCEVTLNPSKPAALKQSQLLQPGDVPFFINPVAFWIASLCLLTVPYRMLFGRYTGQVSISFAKAARGASLVVVHPATPAEGTICGFS